METSGAILQRARKATGISQSELARRAGITQSVISAYENGRRQPSFPTLVRLVEAAGCDLDVTVGPKVSVGTRAAKVGKLRDEILRIAASHRLSNVRIFGSVARGDDGPNSDIDLLVDVPRGVGLFDLLECKGELEELLGERVDLIPAKGLKPSLLAEVPRQAVSL